MLRSSSHAITLILGAVSFTLLSWSSLTPAGEVDDLLQAGIKSFRAKDFAGADQNFSRAFGLRDGDAHLAHDVALSSLQLGNRPKAIAYWRKALAINPNFLPARLGRDVVESRMGARPFERDAVDLAVRRAFERIPLALLAVVTALMLGFGSWQWIGLARDRVRARLDQTDQPRFTFAAVTATFLVLVSGLATLLKYSLLRANHATITTASASARSVPAEDGLALFEVPGGNEVLVRATQGEWIQIENPEGNTGWVKRADSLVE